jgi:NAD+ kinase
MIKRVGIIVNAEKEKACRLGKELFHQLKDREITSFFLDEPAVESALGEEFLFYQKTQFIREAELLITLGGDGTLLRAVPLAIQRKLPILGVNVGRVGFLTEISPLELSQKLGAIKKGKYKITHRVVFRVEVFRKGNPVALFFALNDVVITKEALARMIKLETWIKKEPVALFYSDGLIISTPTGSTAHSLSAGGPILHPEVNAFVITPICAHTLTLRPLVISNRETITVRVSSNHKKIILTLDGQQSFSLFPQDVIKVRKNPHPLKIVFFEERNFYSILKQKLKWGGEK